MITNLTPQIALVQKSKILTLCVFIYFQETLFNPQILLFVVYKLVDCRTITKKLQVSTKLYFVASKWFKLSEYTM